ncbi:hypothetical protein BN7_1386 [Wickerhamomyces ciferrii]|uniref:Uncharacterized protein n=1 Tax=Wickerhamomyces ciferrii (strain ATCC 14091 / BCRC 22168 / CBS 111 / JCM 3599 / NBRC 0793 / NRRL Y-1031 F-60-10) TaxID=1206466 RepID=K0KI60_WICCF|nr:uncharacterized protein BN7_1386 [Wickerhamomyces ciferrii]CCH41847.1 hypothetical protein BN7_1386 [Wickerhamomyces ciferrii]
MVETKTYAGWASVAFQLGILRKPFNYNNMGYVYSAALWTFFGHLFTKGVESQDALLQDRVDKLKAARAARAARHSAATPASEN